jgi:hypothetical protein
MRVKGRKWNIFVPTAGMRDHGAFCVIVVTPFVEFDLELRHLGCYEKAVYVHGNGAVVCWKTHSLQHRGVAITLRASILLENKQLP